MLRAVLGWAVLCCAVLCCAVLCCAGAFVGVADCGEAAERKSVLACVCRLVSG